MFADTTVGTEPPCERQKIASDGESAFFTVIGDELVQEAAAWLAYWYLPKQVDYKSRQTASVLFETAGRLRMLRRCQNETLIPQERTTFLCITRSDAFFYEAKLFSDHDRYGLPSVTSEIPTGQIWVFYAGAAPVRHTMLPDLANPFAQPIEHIKQEHQRRLESGEVALDFISDRHGGVTVPQSVGAPKWLKPFDTLPEMLANRDPRAAPLRNNPLFNLPIPEPAFLAP